MKPVTRIGGRAYFSHDVGAKSTRRSTTMSPRDVSSNTDMVVQHVQSTLYGGIGASVAAATTDASCNRCAVMIVVAAGASLEDV